MSQPISGAASDAHAGGMSSSKGLLLAFIAGFIAVLAFHQSLLAVLVAAGVVSGTPYSLAPAGVTGIPQVFSRALFGGGWGIVLMMLLEHRLARQSAAAFWIGALAIGALLPSLVAWFIVEPIKGLPPAAGGDPARLALALVANGAWGIGTAAVYRLLRAVWGR